ncbi:LOG family protein [Fulvivirga sediminis]|uniref:Cytokinin riboside 5'-monophosphate phosphoribohydrolase n=1 Tax=Fulvivirga sediminis TaxID=2803949 RepID=A0A937F4H2_9BACT|nr:TIGR00730 family Rossman fold protein [Fulvivirga sediminis]MBL3655580.1 TIGR00730 family Rossman fold protein [Fulvivirga sediminis]
MKSVAVFCASSLGKNKIYEETAIALGNKIATKGMRLVYGGAKVGLMGAVANGALQNGGKVIGVIPGFLRTKEVAHEGLTELILTETMQERKTKMHELSDSVITLPGGFGTMEEMFEMLTWGQLGMHKKPMGLLNIDGYYNSLVTLINDMVTKGLLKEVNREMLLVSEDIDDLLAQMQAYKAPEVEKWITKDKA